MKSLTRICYWGQKNEQLWRNNYIDVKAKIYITKSLLHTIIESILVHVYTFRLVFIQSPISKWKYYKNHVPFLTRFWSRESESSR